MNSSIVFIAFAIIVIFTVPQTQSAKVCTINCNTASTSNVCCKLGTVCRRFSNSCNHKLYNCVKNKSCTPVALSYCSYISVGSSGTCKSTTTSTEPSSVSSILNSLTAGGSSSGYTVTPIVIRV